MTHRRDLKRILIPKTAVRLKAAVLKPLISKRINPVKKEFEIGQLGNEELKEDGNIADFLQYRNHGPSLSLALRHMAGACQVFQKKKENAAFEILPALLCQRRAGHGE